jgi:hypothetical protein
MTTRGFSGRRPSNDVARRLPSRQHRTKDFLGVRCCFSPPCLRWRMSLWRFP